MELELGLKITHTRDDITSMADLRISKDPFGPVFVSRETEEMFVLIAHLKGLRSENIHIEINKSGNRITIWGEKPVQEMVLMGLIMYKKEVEIRAFRKVFQVPDVVNLDRIKAKYNEEQSTLTITMRKKVRGIIGLEIEEDNEEAETSMTETMDKEGTDQGIPEEKVDKGEPEDKLVEEERREGQPEVEAGNDTTEELHMEPKVEKSKPEKMEDEVHKEEPQPIEKPIEVGIPKEPEEAIAEHQLSEEIAASPTKVEPDALEAKRDDEQPQTDGLPSIQEAPSEEHHDQLEGVPDIEGEASSDEVKQETDLVPEESQKQEDVADIEEPVKFVPDKDPKQTEEKTEEIGNGKEEADESSEPLQENETDQGLPARAEENKGPSEPKRKKSKLCPPIWYAGSTLLVSLIVIVIHLIRAKKH